MHMLRLLESMTSILAPTERLQVANDKPPRPAPHALRHKTSRPWQQRRGANRLVPGCLDL